MGRKDFLDSINHRSPEKIPLDLGATAVSGVHVSLIPILRKIGGLEPIIPRVIEPYQMLGEVGRELRDRLGVDVAGIPARNTMFGFENRNWKNWTAPWGQDVQVPGEFNVTPAPEGGVQIYPEGDLSVAPSGRLPEGGYFFDSLKRQEPIEEAKLDPRDNREEFGPLSEEDIAHFTSALTRVKQEDRGVILNMGGTGVGDIALVPAPFLKNPKGIRDVEEWYVSLLTRPDYIRAVFDMQIEIALANMAKLYDAVGNAIDVLFICGTDFGTQIGTFCSADTYREMYHPYYKAMNDWVHQNTTWKTFKHSCGAVADFIPLFIESGFDILNPVQCSAAGMDAKTIKREYGRDIVFWGGGVDTQRTLPFGTPEEVHREVTERLEIFSDGGGYVFNPIHNVQAMTPPENLKAMLEAYADFN